jgi:hypothetical protein
MKKPYETLKLTHINSVFLHQDCDRKHSDNGVKINAP